MKFRVAFILLCGFLNAQRYGVYHALIVKSAKDAKIDPSILAGVLKAESNFNPLCVSPMRGDGHRDEGIAQLNSKYKSYFEWRFNASHKIDPYDPRSAIPVAARILAFNRNYFGNWIEALAAYRQGVEGVKMNGVIHTSALYIERIMQYREE